MPDHVSTPLSDAATQLSGIDVGREQMAAPMAPFCVNLSLPYISSDSLPAGTVTIPFVLPPTQEYFNAQTNAGGGKTPAYEQDTPQVKLKSVSFSFDQRGEPAAIASNFWGKTGTPNYGKFGYSSQQGRMSYEDVTKLDISISLLEKDQHYFGDTYPYSLENELWSTVIPHSAFSGPSFRANPFIQTDIDISINQYKTFVLVVHCPGLDDSDDRYLTLPSVEVSLKFVSELLQRDSGETSVQNIPRDGGSGSYKYGAKTGPAVTVTAPSAGEAIKADGSKGVSDNITAIDEQFQDKLQGGYNRFGDVPPTETIKDDAAYDVIAVPLYQNSAHGGISAASTYLCTWPYTGIRSNPSNGRGIFDRRLIPIHHSYTIHHAILAWNWTPWNVLNVPGTSGPIDTSVIAAWGQGAVWAAPAKDIGLKVGVGIGTGSGADNFDYSEVGTVAITNPNNYDVVAKTPKTPDTTGAWDSGLIDRVTSTANPPLAALWDSAAAASVQRKWNWELHSIPLSGFADSPGAGYYNQGDPVFAGPGWSTTHLRSDLAGVGAPTGGMEQWIEVRSLLYPTDTTDEFPEMTLATDTTAPYTPLKDVPSILVGYGGCYVYLICKKHLTE